MPRKSQAPPTGRRPGADPPRPITRAELSRRVGKSRSRITEDCRPGGLLAPACVAGGDVDLAHPAVAAWARRRRIEPGRLEPPAALAQSSAEAPAAPALATPSVAGEYDELTIRKKRAEVERLELRNERDQGRVVSVELVRTLVISHLNTLHLRLLREGADYLAGALLAAARAGETREALIERIRDRMGQDLATANRASFGGLRASVRATRKSGELPEPAEAAEGDPEAAETRARRSALRAARSELRAAAPRLAKSALQFVERGGDDTKASELETMVVAMLDAAIDRAGRPSREEDSKT